VSASGQNDQFPPANPSAGYGFSKQTLAGARGNDEVAPIPAVRGTATEPLESTLCGPSAWHMNS
jgi:hypothetical protein